MDTDQHTAVPRRSAVSLRGATILRLPTDGLSSTSCTASDVSDAAVHRWIAAGVFVVRLDLGDAAAGPAGVRDLTAAVRTLRRLGMLVEYDLDLFGRSPRFSSVRDNLVLLAAITGDGLTPAAFRSGPRVDDCSPWLARYQRRLAVAARPWVGAGGLSPRLADAWAELVVAERLLLGLTGLAAHRIAMQRLTLRSNTELLSLVTRSAADFELHGDTHHLDAAPLAGRCAVLDRAVTDMHAAFVRARDNRAAHKLTG